MTSSKFSDLIKYRIQNEDPEEIKYIEHTKEAGLKLCGKLLHDQSHNDEVQVITQLSRSSDDCNTLQQSKTGERSQSSSQSSRSTADFIKGVSITHSSKSKSLDHTHNTKIKAVIGNNNFPFETVVSLSHDGSSMKQSSFVRRSLPESLHQLSSDKSSGTSSQQKTSKGWFKLIKKTKKDKKKQSHDLTDEELDKLAIEHVKGRSIQRLESENLSRKAHVSSPSTKRKDIPFKSHDIGTLPPIKKGKTHKIFKILKPLLPKNRVDSPKEHQKTFETDNDVMMKNKPSIVGIKIKNNEEFKYAVDEESAKITDKFPNIDCHPLSRDAVMEIDENKNENNTINISHIDVPIGASNECENNIDNQISTNNKCGCNWERIGTIVEALETVIDKKAINLSKIIKVTNEMNDPNWNGHFQNCHLKTNKKRERRQSEPVLSSTEIVEINTGDDSYPSINMDKLLSRKQNISVVTKTSTNEDLRKSNLSLYSSHHCVECHDDDEDEENDVPMSESVAMTSSSSADEKLAEEFKPVIPDIIDQLEQNEQIFIEHRHYRYFSEPHCYDHFEKGVIAAIGTEPTLENLAVLHCLIQNIFRRQKSDISVDSKFGKTILAHADKFFLTHYKPVIERDYGNSLENFISHHTSATPISPDVD